MLGVWNEILVGLQPVRAIAHRRQVLDLLPWECLGSLDQPARDRLVMDPENSADSSNPHPFEIELTGLLLEGWIFASS